MTFVYKFVDYQNNIIYIGKTKKIENRMRQHFNGDGHLPMECYQNVSHIFVIELNGKTNMDMYETYLINKYTPKYNVDKQFKEHMNLHNNDFIKINEVEWKELFFVFNKNGISISFKPIKYPFFENNLSNYDKCIKLLEYNYYQLIYRPGFYENYLCNIFNDHDDMIEYLKLIHKEILDGKVFDLSLSCFDEPLSSENDAFEYVAINLNCIKSINLVKLLTMVQCKMLVRITNNIYGIVVHSPYTLKQFEQHYYLNEYEMF